MIRKPLGIFVERAQALLARFGLAGEGSAGLNDLTKDMLFYSLGPLVAGLSGAVLVPILTRIFTPAHYGTAETVLSFVSTLMVVLILGMDAAAAILYFDDDDRAYRRRIASTGLIFLFALGSVAAMVLILFSDELARFVFKDVAVDDVKPLLSVALPALPFGLVDGYLKHVLRWNRQRSYYLITYLSSNILRLTLSIYLASLYGMKGLIAAWAFSLGVSVLLGFGLGRNNYRLLVSSVVIKRLAVIGLPLGVLAIATPLQLLMDRILLLHFRTADEVGFYSAAVAVASVFALASEGFRLAWGPIAFSRWRQPEFPGFFAQLVHYYWIIGALAAVAVGLVAPVVVDIFLPEDYANISSILSTLVLALVIQELFSLFGIGLYFRKQTYFFVVAAVVGLFVGVGLDWLLIPTFGIKGAAAARAANQLSAAACVYYFSQRLMPIPYRRARLLSGSAFAVLATAFMFR